MKKHPVLYSVTLCAASAALTLLACALFFWRSLGGRENVHSILRFVEARDGILRYAVTETNLDSLTEGAIAGMVDALGDRWSYYMDEETYARYQDYSANQYRGIGITVLDDGEARGLLIIEVAEDSPAALAGILPEMRLLEVGGVSMGGKSAQEAREAILAAGEEVRLLLETASGESYSVTVCPELLTTRIVTGQLMEDTVGYARIANFEAGAAEETIKALEALLEQGAQALLFDVRGNPGGQLTELTELLDYLLPEGEIFRGFDRTGREYVQRSDAASLELPMGVLIDQHCYSAAEYFAAVLREYDRAFTAGEGTTGKSRSQQNLPLMDGDVLHISTAGYITPGGADLTEQGGLVPDLPVARGEGEDLQLRRALERLKGAS